MVVADVYPPPCAPVAMISLTASPSARPQGNMNKPDQNSIPWGLITAMCGAQVLVMVGFASFPALVGIFVTEWGLSNTEVGWISGLYFAG